MDQGKDIAQFENNRKVTKHFKRIYPFGSNKVNLLCSDSMYASSCLDGKVKIL